MEFLLRLMLALWLGIVVSTPSEARYACAVVKTADGFATLRQGPSARHPEVAKMKPQELVGLLHPDRDDIVRSGDWLFVRWYPGTRRTAFQIPKVDETCRRSDKDHDRRARSLLGPIRLHSRGRNKNGLCD